MEINKIQDVGKAIFVEVEFEHGIDRVLIKKNKGDYNSISYVHDNSTVKDSIEDEEMYVAYEELLSALGEIVYLRNI